MTSRQAYGAVTSLRCRNTDWSCPSSKLVDIESANSNSVQLDGLFVYFDWLEAGALTGACWSDECTDAGMGLVQLLLRELDASTKRSLSLSSRRRFTLLSSLQHNCI